MSDGQLLRALPAVDRLAEELMRVPDSPAATPTRAEAIAAARAAIAERRGELLARGEREDELGFAGDAGRLAAGDGAREATALVERARRRLRPSLRRVLNGTGVVIHTNLGRAPLAVAGVAA
ncbi:MAG: hypothetical protein ACYCU0_15415, partial [Solirubrobacteraceae bacterium]